MKKRPEPPAEKLMVLKMRVEAVEAGLTFKVRGDSVKVRKVGKERAFTFPSDVKERRSGELLSFPQSTALATTTEELSGKAWVATCLWLGKAKALAPRSVPIAKTSTFQFDVEQGLVESHQVSSQHLPEPEISAMSFRLVILVSKGTNFFGHLPWIKLYNTVIVKCEQEIFGMILFLNGLVFLLILIHVLHFWWETLRKTKSTFNTSFLNKSA